MASDISDNPQFIVNGFICARIARALDAHYNGDQPGASDESGQDDSDETGEEETDDDDDQESVINLILEEEEIDVEDEHKSDEEDSVCEDGNGTVVELEPQKESDCEDGNI